MNATRFVRVSRAVMLVVLLVAVGLASVAATAVQEQETGVDSTAAFREVTDMRGRVVSVPTQIDAIVALGANSLRLLTYFDSVAKVVAVEDTGHAREKSVHDFFYLATYRIAHPELRELPSIGSEENHEAIIAADPDIVFSSTVDVAALDQLQSTLGIPVFAIDADVEIGNTDRFLEQFRLVGDLLGEAQRAAELITGVEEILADLDARAARVSEPKRAYAGGMMFYGPADLLRTTGDYAPFDFTNTENVMPTNPVGNQQPYVTSLEELVRADPDYVFIDAANIALSLKGYRSNEELLDEQVTAFENRDVYTTLVYKYYGTNWENQIINIYYAGTVLYPEVFSDVSAVAKAEEIWRLFFQVPLSYDEVVELQAPGMGRADWW
ncbi:MAG: ABC transporter substrate-binding protein [Spirochaetota bacterium]